MITTVLAIFTLAAALGEAPPQIISTHKTYAECQNARRQLRWGRLARQKLLHEKWQEMQKNTTFPACLRVVFEDAKDGDRPKESEGASTIDTKKGDGE